MRPLTLDVVRGATPLLLLFVAWWAAGRFGWVNPLVLPPLGEVVGGLGDPAVRGPLLAGLAGSAARLALGALAGVAAGVAFGAAMGLARPVEAIALPSFNAFRQVALFAWVPLLTAWFGGGDVAKVVFIALSAFKPAAMGTYEGFRTVPALYRDVGRVLCFSPSRTLTRIALPAALPSIVGGLQLALIYAWLAAIGAEYVMGGVAEGIGTFVVAAREHLQLQQVYLGVLVIAVAGLTLNKAVRVGGERALAWRHDGR
jgi:sulfonate transport system permease protein